MSEERLIRPKARPSRAQAQELFALVRKRDMIDVQIDMEQELRARRVDRLLRSAGYEVRRKQRWPEEPLPGAEPGVILRRGPAEWGDLVRVQAR